MHRNSCPKWLKVKVQCKNFKNEQQIHLAHTQIIQCLESRGLVYNFTLYLLPILTHTLHLSHLGYFFHQAYLTVNYYAFQLQTRRHYEFGGGISESWWATSLDFFFFFPALFTSLWRILWGDLKLCFARDQIPTLLWETNSLYNLIVLRLLGDIIR